MSRLRAALLLLTLLIVPSEASAEPLRAIFDSANRAYFAGDLEEAQEGYQRLVAAGVADPDVFYNLGLARARAGAYGRAIVAFEKTLQLRPGDDDALAARDAARDALAQAHAASEGEAVSVEEGSLLAALGSTLPEPVLAYLVLALNLLTFGALAGLVWTRRETLRIALGVTAPIAFMLFVLAGLGLLGRTDAFGRGTPAIVVDDHSVMREGPDPHAGEAGELREGDRVRILNHHETYYEIMCLDGSRGWVDEDAVGRLDLFPEDA
jgi:tetratricopeptide (TPR) repeat protein